MYKFKCYKYYCVYIQYVDITVIVGWNLLLQLCIKRHLTIINHSFVIPFINIAFYFLLFQMICIRMGKKYFYEIKMILFNTVISNKIFQFQIINILNYNIQYIYLLN